jgi:hypothetical protein
MDTNTNTNTSAMSGQSSLTLDTSQSVGHKSFTPSVNAILALVIPLSLSFFHIIVCELKL